MSIALIGDGAIARYVRGHINDLRAVILRPARLSDPDNVTRIAQARDLPDDVTLVVDCAGHAGLAEHGPDILRSGRGLITVSLGALADQALHDRLVQAARDGGAQLHLASGAIGALDCLSAASVGGLDHVRYTGRKPPKGWAGSAAEDVLDLSSLSTATAHFSGTARDAALRYPKNANVAAAVALAGTGFDDTQVDLIADPEARANIHEVTAQGAFGSFTFRIEGKALPDNPKSSALAAMSAVASVRRMQREITI